MSIYLSNGAQVLELPRDLVEGHPEDRARHLRHAGHRCHGPQRGQPITLQGDGNSAWISRATLRTLKAWSGIPGLRMTLRILAEEFEVVFDHGDAEETRAIAMQSVIEYSDPEDSDYYCSLVLRFIEASETL